MKLQRETSGDPDWLALARASMKIGIIVSACIFEYSLLETVVISHKTLAILSSPVTGYPTLDKESFDSLTLRGWF
jgi:type IV secretory pathway VirB3-like protein